MKELIALAKEKPGKLQLRLGRRRHASSISAPNCSSSTAKVDLLHVPFKGGGPAMIDVLGGHTKVMFSSLVQTMPHIKTGKLRALGTGGKERSSGPARRADDRGSRRARLRGAQLVGPRWRRPARRRRSSSGCTRRWTEAQDARRSRTSSTRGRRDP